MATPASSGSGEKEQIETVCQLDHARAVMIVPGVMLCPLVDAEQGAKDVLVGVLTIEPDALYPFYTRPVTESLTLLQGARPSIPKRGAIGLRPRHRRGARPGSAPGGQHLHHRAGRLSDRAGREQSLADVGQRPVRPSR